MPVNCDREVDPADSNAQRPQLVEYDAELRLLSSSLKALGVNRDRLLGVEALRVRGLKIASSTLALAIAS